MGSLTVPSANRGLKGEALALAQVATSGGTPVFVDFLTFTGDVVCTLRNLGFSQSDCAALESAHETGDGIEQVAMVLFDEFLGGVDGIRIDPELRGFRNFYSNHLRIFAGDKQVGFVALGGDRQRGTFCIELTGEGCSHVEEWEQLKTKLVDAGCRLTRVDVAFDDFEGKHDLAHCVALYRRGAFTRSGRPPALGRQGWNDDSGRTLYVGKNKGNQQLCVYEKGKQLGDPSSKWVRWEGRFGSKYRDIDFDILTSPARFFVGHYPALDFIRALGVRMLTHIRKTSASLASSMRWCRHQYGALLNMLFVHAGSRERFSRICETLANSKFPKWAFTGSRQEALARHASVDLRFAELEYLS